MTDRSEKVVGKDFKKTKNLERDRDKIIHPNRPSVIRDLETIQPQFHHISPCIDCKFFAYLEHLKIVRALLMDGNKDEAFKCLKIAKDSIFSGDRNRALKFINKARKLDPFIQINDLLSNLNGSQSENQDSNKPTSKNAFDFDPLRSGARKVPSSVPLSNIQATYTEEQVTIAREIKRKKDYYDILGVGNSCSSDDLRKAYRKLSLKVHPDKNNAPGAEEAFKMVSKAFQCLSNEESRRKYDLVGSDEPVYEKRGDNGGGNGFYEGEEDAEEIFRNFFFGGMHPATTANFNGFSFGPGVRVRTDGVANGSNWPRTLIHLLPVLLLLLVNFLPSSGPIYSLTRSYSYNYRFTTQKGVNFYVKSADFDVQLPPHSPERVATEKRVEGDYHSVLEQKCRLEWQQHHWGYRRETPSCDALKCLEAVS